MNTQPIEEAIREFFKIPQMLTSPASVQFVTDYLDLVLFHGEWRALQIGKKREVVGQILEQFVKVGYLVSSKTKTKTHLVADDIVQPHLLVYTRVYRRNR